MKQAEDQQSECSWSPYLKHTHAACSTLTPAKAKYLSSRHSRSMTLFAALARLGVLDNPTHSSPLLTHKQKAPPQQPNQQDSTDQKRSCDPVPLNASDQGEAEESKQESTSYANAPVRPWQPGEELRITIAGADRNEGTSAVETAVRFGELLRLCGAAGVRRVRLMLCGPAVDKSRKSGTLLLPLDTSWPPSAHSPLSPYAQPEPTAPTPPPTPPPSPPPIIDFEAGAATSTVDPGIRTAADPAVRTAADTATSTAANSRNQTTADPLLNSTAAAEQPQPSPRSSQPSAWDPIHFAQPLGPVTSVTCEAHPKADLSQTSGDERARAHMDSVGEEEDAEAGRHAQQHAHQLARKWVEQQQQVQRQQQQQHAELRRAASTQSLLSGSSNNRRRLMQAQQQQEAQAQQEQLLRQHQQQEVHAELRRAATTLSLQSLQNGSGGTKRLQQQLTPLQAQQQQDHMQRVHSSQSLVGFSGTNSSSKPVRPRRVLGERQLSLGAQGLSPPEGLSPSRSPPPLLQQQQHNMSPEEVSPSRSPPPVLQQTHQTQQQQSQQQQEWEQFQQGLSQAAPHEHTHIPPSAIGAAAEPRTLFLPAPRTPSPTLPRPSTASESPAANVLDTHMVVRVAYVPGRLHDMHEEHGEHLGGRQAALAQKQQQQSQQLSPQQQSQQQQSQQPHQPHFSSPSQMPAQWDAEAAAIAAEMHDLDTPEHPPHLVACFNAGVWGYGFSWTDTIKYATHELQAPVLLTAYSIEEAEDDEDTIDEAGLGHCMLWGAERNPYGSMRTWRWSEVLPPANNSSSPAPVLPPVPPELLVGDEEEDANEETEADKDKAEEGSGSESGSSSKSEEEVLTSNQAWLCFGPAVVARGAVKSDGDQ